MARSWATIVHPSRYEACMSSGSATYRIQSRRAPERPQTPEFARINPHC